MKILIKIDNTEPAAASGLLTYRQQSVQEQQYRKSGWETVNW